MTNPDTSQLGVSRVDAPAIDPGGEHPALVYLARCGHRLLRRTTLCEVSPARRCPAYVRWSNR